ncbi:MAG: hypothetical protein K8R85_05195 [Bacteroidetes bacterium]|nr:hypothetical protein [Bacteroidota bacterium]
MKNNFFKRELNEAPEEIYAKLKGMSEDEIRSTIDYFKDNHIASLKSIIGIIQLDTFPGVKNNAKIEYIENYCQSIIDKEVSKK